MVFNEPFQKHEAPLRHIIPQGFSLDVNVFVKYGKYTKFMLASMHSETFFISCNFETHFCISKIAMYKISKGGKDMIYSKNIDLLDVNIYLKDSSNKRLITHTMYLVIFHII